MFGCGIRPTIRRRPHSAFLKMEAIAVRIPPKYNVGKNNSRTNFNIRIPKPIFYQIPFAQGMNPRVIPELPPIYALSAALLFTFLIEIQIASYAFFSLY